MQPAVIVLIIIGAILLVLALVKLGMVMAERERQRREALAAWAEINGFAFHKDDPFNLDHRLSGVLDIGRGHDRYACEVLSRTEPVPAFFFQYHFKTWETRTVTRRDSRGNTYTTTERYEQTHWRRYLIVEIAAPFPSLLIRPEGWFDKLAGFVGFSDVNFESEQFSRRFFVKCADRAFAYAVIHPQMMEWMLPQRMVLQLERGRLLIDASGSRHDAADCHARWSQAVGFINRIPAFVWQDYAKLPRIELPEPSPLPPPAAADAPSPVTSAGKSG